MTYVNTGAHVGIRTGNPTDGNLVLRTWVLHWKEPEKTTSTRPIVCWAPWPPGYRKYKPPA